MYCGTCSIRRSPWNCPLKGCGENCPSPRWPDGKACKPQLGSLSPLKPHDELLFGKCATVTQWGVVYWVTAAPSMFIELPSPVPDERFPELQVWFDRRERAQLESEETPVTHSPDGKEKLEPLAEPCRNTFEGGSSELPVDITTYINEM